SRLAERGQGKVLDFGVAKRYGPDQTDHDVTQEFRGTQEGRVLGTPSYMSPEQALGKDLDQRSDLFSVGVVLYELATGHKPFIGDTLTEVVNRIVHAQPPALARLNYDIPPELERITLKCLQKQPDRRYQSARELMVDLRNLARALEQGDVSSDPALVSRMASTGSYAGPVGTAAAEPTSLDN